MGVSISLSGLLSLDLEGNGDRGLEDLATHVWESGGSLPTLSCHAMPLSAPVCFTLWFPPSVSLCLRPSCKCKLTSTVSPRSHMDSV